MSLVNCSRKISRGLTARTVACCILLLGSAAAVWANGSYQRTRDGKTLVWNDDPLPGDIAAWSGDRDSDGYATGFGTLTWYKLQKRSDKEAKPTLYAYYFGNMIRGKFNGPVNGHSRGLTNHAFFSDGKRTSRWAAGTVPSWNVPRPGPSAVEQNVEEIVVAKPTKIEPTEFQPPPPSYANVAAARRPVPDFDSLHQRSKSGPAVDVPGEGPASKGNEGADSPSANDVSPRPPRLDMDDSLLSLTGTPASLNRRADALQARRRGSTSAAGNGQLSRQEVIHLADAEARKHGYNLDKYQRLEPQFDPADGIWSLFYAKNPGSDGSGTDKPFTVAIDDKTKRTAIVPRR